MPVKIGDTYTFDRGDIVFPITPPGQWFPADVDGGISVPAGTYSASLVGEIAWQRPSAGPVNLQIELDLDGFNVVSQQQLPGGDEAGGFDSGLTPRYQYEAVESSGQADLRQTINSISVMVVPANCQVKFRLQATPGYSVTLLTVRLVLSAVTLK